MTAGSDIRPARGRGPIDGAPSFTVRNRAYRLAWGVVYWTLFRWSPPWAGGFRNRLLTMFGARLAATAQVSPRARIWSPRNLVMGDRAAMAPGVDCYNMATVSIGARTVVSQRAFLCAGSHDIADPDFQLIARPIVIGENVWIAAEAMLGPGAVVGDGAVIGARAVLFGAAEGGYVHVGNPAVKTRPRRPVGR
jgi:putative colanic acid biosynthesis acetyltransferase WcaF